MKIQLARKLHRLPQPSTQPTQGQFAIWPPGQHAILGLPTAGLAGSPSRPQMVSRNTAAD